MPLFLSILTMKYEVGMEIMTKITRCPDNTRDHPNKQAALCLAADPTRPLYLRDANYLCLYLKSRLIRQLFQSFRPIFLTGYPFRTSRVDALTMSITVRQH